MKNLKKIGIVIAVLVVVIVIAIVFRDQWIPLVDSFLAWIQRAIGLPDDKQWHFASAVSNA